MADPKLPFATDRPEIEILGPEDQNSAHIVSDAEQVFAENMEAMNGRVLNIAFKSGIPIYGTDFNYTLREGKKEGVLSIQTGGRDGKMIPYIAEIDQSENTIGLTHINPENGTKTQIVQESLDEDGFVSEQTYENIANDVSARVGIDPVRLWALMNDADIIDGDLGPTAEDFTAN